MKLIILIIVILNCDCITFNKYPKEIFEQNINNVVLVFSAQEESKCTGFFIKNDIITTAAHCIGKNELYVFITKYDKSIIIGTPILVDNKMDIAFLFIDKQLQIIAPLINKESHIGERIVVLGFPGYMMVASNGIQQEYLTFEVRLHKTIFYNFRKKLFNF